VGGKVQLGIGPVTTGVRVSRRWRSATTSMMADGGQSMMADGPQSAIPDVTTDRVGVYGSYGRSLGGAAQLDVGGRLDWARTTADPTKAKTNADITYQRARVAASGSVYRDWLAYLIAFGPQAKENEYVTCASPLVIRASTGVSSKSPQCRCEHQA